MTSSPSPAAHDTSLMRELHWSHSEKAAARRAFDLALSREFEAIIRETKSGAAKIEEASGLWELEHWLGQRRREIDSKYDYRYSVLPLVFGVLLRNGRLSEDELQGLSPDKLDRIRQIARF